LKAAGLSPSTFYSPKRPAAAHWSKPVDIGFKTMLGNLITVTALNSRFKIDHSKPALA
jgi:hypothetical protein